MQKITPCLWFDTQAEEAVTLYVSVIKNSKVLGVSRCGEGGPFPAGTVLASQFVLNGQEFMALNGNKQDAFTNAVSFSISCETQSDIDHYWEKLSAGGTIQMCGWLKDRYGVSWQIVPAILGQLMGSPDPAKNQRTMAAMMQMKKLEIAKLIPAHEGK